MRCEEHGEMGNAYEILLLKMMESNHLGDKGVDGKIILKK
jgi:hypothetical protein